MGAIPTVEITNGERRLIVNACDLSTWEAAGWSKPKPAAPPEEAAAPPTVKAEAAKK